MYNHLYIIALYLYLSKAGGEKLMGLRWSTTLITLSTQIYQAIFQRESEKSTGNPP